MTVYDLEEVYYEGELKPPPTYEEIKRQALFMGAPPESQWPVVRHNDPARSLVCPPCVENVEHHCLKALERKVEAERHLPTPPTPQDCELCGEPIVGQHWCQGASKLDAAMEEVLAEQRRRYRRQLIADLEAEGFEIRPPTATATELEQVSQ